MTIPKISIVMPSYNQGDFLESAIVSILDQDCPNLEFVIIDGGSTDKSISILERYSDDITFWSSKPDKGQSDALNTGFNITTGDIIGWLNSDDTFQAGTFEEVARILSDQSVNIAMCRRFGLMDTNGLVFDYKDNSFKNHQTLIRYWSTGGMTINQPSVFFRRNVISKYKPVLNTKLHYAMDYDLWLRITLEHDIQVVDGHWANYRFHDTSKSGLGFDDFLPEWYSVSKKYWGEKGSASWWLNWLHRQIYHNSIRIYHGVPNRLKRLMNG
jgi:glycosyltransferase involved in cell wall biosynthesis